MTSRDLFARASELFDQAIELPEEERLAFVRDQSGEDTELESEVISLLQAGARAGEFLGGSAIASIGGEDAWLGKTIGSYRLEGIIAGGGMGVVFRAHQEQPSRDVALKLIRGDALSRKALQRFELEAELLGQLDHPGIARVYDAGTTGAALGQQPYFVMELIDGLPLTEFAREMKLSTKDRIELLIRVCEGVNHAHQNGIVHRDLKPANILVRPDGQPKILDFGVARHLDDDVRATTFRTDAGQVVGTLPYMSPEQVRGQQDELDTRSDVYALGVLCYEVLTDRLPQALQGKSLIEAARVIEEDEPSSLGDGEQRFPSDLETIVRKCLEKDKEQRYGSPGELAADLQRFLDSEPILARPPSTVYQFRKFAKRNRGVVLTGAAGVAVLLAGLIVSVAGWSRAEHARARAETEAEKSRVLSEFMVTLLESPDPWESGPDVRVLDVLGNATSVIDRELGDLPEVAASAHLSLGDTYRGMGRYEDAEHHFRHALARLDAILEPGDPRLYPPLESLGDVFIDTGRLDSADSMAVRIRGVMPRLDPRGVEIIDALHFLGGLEEAHGRLEEAIPHIEDALARARASFGNQSEVTFVMAGALGNLLWQVDRLDEATPLMAAACEMGIALYGADNPDVLVMHNNLAYLYNANGDQALALETFEQVLKDKIRVLGELNSSTAMGYNAVAKQLYNMDRPAEAIPFHERALAIADSLLGDADVRTQSFRGSFALSLIDLGRPAEAEPILTGVYDAMVGLSGPEHPNTRKIAGVLADLYETLNQPTEAERYRGLAGPES